MLLKNLTLFVSPCFVGIGRWLGGILGALMAGFFGGAGIQNWRQGRRLGYERLGGGRRTWTEFFQAFLCAFANGVRRHDDGELIDLLSTIILSNVKHGLFVYRSAICH